MSESTYLDIDHHPATARTLENIDIGGLANVMIRPRVLTRHKSGSRAGGINYARSSDAGFYVMTNPPREEDDPDFSQEQQIALDAFIDAQARRVADDIAAKIVELTGRTIRTGEEIPSE